jgi:hypothetical protein
MSSYYQKLEQYRGSLYGAPTYKGLEYDWEVPDNMTVESPGGASSIHHHWTKGFYGRGNTSSDIFAGQGDRYIDGIYGNLYQTGQTAPQEIGMYPRAPDVKYWRNTMTPHTEQTTMPPGYDYYDQGNIMNPPFPPQVRKEGFGMERQQPPEIEFLDPAGAPETGVKTGKTKPHAILVVLVAVFINLCGNFLFKFLEGSAHVLHNEPKLTHLQYGIYGAFLLLSLMATVYLLDDQKIM